MKIRKIGKVYRGARASDCQKEYLLQFLEENLEFANDKFQSVDGAKARDSTWLELASELNTLGGALKDGQKWRKYWTDLRQNTRNKYCKLKENGEEKTISTFEARVLQIANKMSLSVNGDNEDEIGFIKMDKRSVSDNEATTFESLDEECVVSPPTIATTSTVVHKRSIPFSEVTQEEPPKPKLAKITLQTEEKLLVLKKEKIQIMKRMLQVEEEKLRVQKEINDKLELLTTIFQ